MALGSNPLDPNSRPVNLPRPVAIGPVFTANLRIALDFATANADSIVLTGHLPVNGVYPVGQTIVPQLYTVRGSVGKTKTSR